MNDLKNILDSCMEKVVIKEDTIQNVLSSKKILHFRRRVLINKILVVIPILFLLAGTTAAAQHIYYKWTIKINGNKLPGLEEMDIIQINENNDEDIQICFFSISELESYLGINLLESPYAQKDNNYYVHYNKIGVGYNEIRVPAYIIGDTKNIIYEDDTKTLYSWTDGTLYKKPLDMKILFISDSRQGDIGQEYLGDYLFIENYKCEQGYSVNILKKDLENLYLSDYGEISAYKAVFVAEGLQYEINVRTTMNELKEIINSFR